ncbi:hypothetical protein C8F04DRAFT_1395565 [Mycena alexandri]|uniref:Uncharacterized protein n=1 Tax=Mycena alexandri TaxID=1745969 RepID=A0AAD6SVT1_9AGAR|nr:hypothetical protein C8F04DRAFT_1395565 [Mycena alexandri]
MSKSGSGANYYHEEIKELLRLLQRLPETIPVGVDHDLRGYAPDAGTVDETGCAKSVVAHDIEDIIVTSKSRGPGLEEVTTVLRDYITGNGGRNVLLTQWVDDLWQAARTAIQAAGNSLPREIQTTTAKRLFEHDAIVDKAVKKAKVDQKVEKERRKAAVDIAKKRTEQGAMYWPFDDLVDDPAPEPATAATCGDVLSSVF